MAHSIQDIATALGAEAFGAVDILVNGASEPATAGPEDLALAMAPAYGDALAQGHAKAAVIWPGADWQALGLQAAIVAPRARLAMAHLTQMLDAPLVGAGVHPTASVDPTASLGPNVTVGAFSVIGAGAVIRDECWIGPHVTIAESVTIGPACQIHAGVRLQRRTTLGARVILQPNAAIGNEVRQFCE